jgi:hypothetical protein
MFFSYSLSEQLIWRPVTQCGGALLKFQRPADHSARLTATILLPYTESINPLLHHDASPSSICSAAPSYARAARVRLRPWCLNKELN